MTSRTPAPSPARDLGIHLPSTWRRRCDPTRGILLAARAGSVPPSGRRPDLTVRCVLVEESLVPWRERVLGELSDRLDYFALEDSDEFDLFGHEVAYRRFAHREEPHDVVCDQWAWVHQGLGITLTCSVAREDYADFCDLFEIVAESIDLSAAG